LPERAVLIVAEAPLSPRAARPPDAHEVDALAAAAGISGEWWEVSGRHTLVSAATKLALLDCFNLPARTQNLARESLDRLIAATSARALPPSVTLTTDARPRVPLRSDPAKPQGPIAYHVTLEDGSTLSGSTPGADARRRSSRPEFHEMLARSGFKSSRQDSTNRQHFGDDGRSEQVERIQDCLSPRLRGRRAVGFCHRYHFFSDLFGRARCFAPPARQFARLRQRGQQRPGHHQASRPQRQMPEKTGNHGRRLGLAKAIDETEELHDVGRQCVELGDRRAGMGELAARRIRPGQLRVDR